MLNQNSQDEKINVICLTPVRNEELILDHFLKCASLWADHIIISDQDSTDSTPKIAINYPKVRLIRNKFSEYDEGKIRKITYDEARKIEGKRLLIALDADEVFIPEIFKSDIWDRIISAQPGTVIKSKFVNIMPDLKHYWTGPKDLCWGFMDDGSLYNAKKIHTNRMIYPENAKELILSDLKIMHFQYTDWERMESKHRWYQCWEKINNPEYTVVKYYRGYHHMYSVKPDEIHDIPDFWFAEYKKMGINIDEVNKEGNYYWDKAVLDYLDKYGTKFFREEAIWDVNWVEKAKYYKYENPKKFKDPRNIFNKLIHWWLKRTQKDFNKLSVRIVAKLLKVFFKK